MRVRAAAAGAAALLLGVSAPAAADVTEFIGQPVVAQRVESDGRPLTDGRILDLVETHVGDPLRMAVVRESIAHLFSLGRFSGVVVRATAMDNGVSLVYVLEPMRQIAGISFRGADVAGVNEGRLRRLVAERFGPVPATDRAPDIAAVIQADLRQLGYIRATVSSSAEDIAGGRTRLVFSVLPGTRARIGSVDVDGDAGEVEAALLKALQLSPGTPFERERLNERVDRYLDAERDNGFYAARLTYVPQFIQDDRLVNLTVSFERGAHVRIVFAGDPLPADRRETFVPLGREGSADEDLLEDASQRIEEFLRSQGYRDAVAPHAREERVGELVITFTVHHGPQYRVGRVDVAGNVSIPLTDLQPRLRVKPDQPFFEPAIDADLAIVESLYRQRGFASVKAVFTTESQAASAGATEVPVAIRIAVSEGVRTTVRAVHIIGTQALDEAQLREGLALQTDGSFSAGEMAADREALQLRLANLGYQSASVTANPGLSADGTRADVVFNVQEGPRVFVDHVLIVGNQRTRTATIERELQFKPGDPLGLEAVNESQRRLAALGLFRRARITELRHGNETRRDVLVTVEEAPVTTIGYGGGVEAGQRLRANEVSGVADAEVEFAPRAFFEVGRRNLFGKNRSVNLFTRVSLGSLQSQTTTRTGLGFGEYRVIGTYREPRVFGSAADAFLTATLEQQSRSSFNFARRAFGAELGRRLTRHVSVSGNYQIQRTELFDETIDPAFRIPIDRVFPQIRLSSFSSSIVRDTRDDLADPASGRFLSANGQAAGRLIGSEVGFAKGYFVGQSFTVLPKTRRTVLAVSGRLGLASAFPRDTIDRDENGDPILGADGQPNHVIVRDLPASERFFAGGDTTVRGFALDQLGTAETIDKDGFPTGGSGLVIVNAEVRVPVFHGFGVVGFVDAGNVFARTSSISLTRLRSAVGFGLRYKSPIGPIRVDVGFKVHRHTTPPDVRESLTAVHISLGQAF